MKRIGTTVAACMGAGLLGISETSATAQTTWITTPGGAWNVAGNWDAGVPSLGLPAVIGAGFNVSYDLPMAAESFGGLNNSGTLTVNTNGFVVDAFGGVPYTGQTGSALVIGSQGVVTITNSAALSLGTSASITVNGGKFIMAGNFAATTLGLNGNNAGMAFTNNAGTVVFDQPLQIRSRYSGFIMNGGSLTLQMGGGLFESSNDMLNPFLVNGGVANLGAFEISRTGTTGGLRVQDGVVNLSSLRVGTTAAAAYATVTGGAVTNTGAFRIGDRANGATSGNRQIHFVQSGGTVVATAPEGIVVNNLDNAGAASSAIIGAFLDLSGGTLRAEKLTLNADNAFLNAWATLNLTGTGVLYLGSGGLVANAGSGAPASSGYFVNLNGGTLAATAPFTLFGDVTLGGSGTIQAANAAGTPFDVTMTGGFKGAGALSKTGMGRLVVQGAGTHTGVVNVDAGTLVLQGGSLPATTTIRVAAGAAFDPGAPFTLALGQTLTGGGAFSNAVSGVAGSFVLPGGDGAIGQLTFAGGFASGGATMKMDISTTASRDQIEVGGALDFSGGGTLLVNPLNGLSAGTYPLFHYGTLNGSLAGLTVAGVVGTLVDNPAAKTVSLMVESASRPSTNLVWKGGGANDWDYTTKNWSAGGSPESFLPQDAVIFDNTGSANGVVNLADVLTPASVRVDSTANYTFTGSGRISGGIDLVKTNGGKLTITTDNTYTGGTFIRGGTVSVATLNPPGTAGPLGASSGEATNLVLSGGGVLEYTGTGISAARGIELGTGGGGLTVTDAAATLVRTGVIVGPGSLTKRGPGILDLNAANTYAGGTIVKEGFVRLGNAAGSGTGTVSLEGATDAAVLRFGADGQTLGATLNVVGTNNATENRGNNTLQNITGSGRLLLDVFDSGTTLTVAGDMSSFSGTLVAGEVGNLRMHPSTGSALAAFDLGQAGSYLNNRNGNLVVHLGALRGGPTTGLIGASSANAPTTYIIGERNEDMLFEGVISESAANRVLNLVKAGTGRLTLGGLSTYTGQTVVSNGVLALNDAASIGTSTNVLVRAGAFLDVSVRSDGVFYVGATQSLGGSGTVRGSIDTSSGGTVSPGASIGTLTVTNAATLYGTTIMELDRSGAPTSDKLVAKTITLGGTIEIRVLAGALQIGDTFDLFDGAITDFGVAVVPPTGVTFDTSKLAVDGTIKVTGAPVPPSIGQIRIGPGKTTVEVSGTGGAAFGTYHVLSSTNAAASLATWTSVATNLFEANGSFSFTNAVNPALGAQFFLIQQQ